MINWKLVGLVESSKHRIQRIVLLNSSALLMQGIFLVLVKVWIDRDLRLDETAWMLCGIAVVAVIAKNWFIQRRFKQSMALSNEAKESLRARLFKKISSLEPSVVKKLNAAELGQLMSEGIDQCEHYFGAYVPQFFYAFLAPFILSLIVGMDSVQAAVWLLVCVPLIPVSIMVVQKIAKRILAKYWGSYTRLSDHFLDRVKGLKTLKLFDVDAQMQVQIDEDAEAFRKQTMRVLIMQLNSISIMDWVAYGGACGAILIALVQYNQGMLRLSSLVFIALISAEFFIPMRQLGSFFHIGMNGAQAAQRIFAILDLETSKRESHLTVPEIGYHLDSVSVNYGEKRALDRISLDLDLNQFIGIVGESGSGKSTLVSLLAGFNTDYEGSVTLDGLSFKDLAVNDIYQHIVYVGSDSSVFQGTIRSNLEMGASYSDEALYAALRAVSLDGFVVERGGLESQLEQGSESLSVGQKQRLCLARCFLRTRSVVLLDEVASGVDLESEMIILDAIRTLKTLNNLVVLVSHRLRSVQDCDAIIVLENGRCAGMDTHTHLMDACEVYQRLIFSQQARELFYQRASEQEGL